MVKKVKIAKLTGAEAKKFDEVIDDGDGYTKSIEYLLSINKIFIQEK